MRGIAIALSVLLAAPAAADSPDLVKELKSIAAKLKVKGMGSLANVAGPGCAAVAKAERLEVMKRVRAWLDREFPDEYPGEAMSPDDDNAFVMRIGCKDPTGYIGVDVSQDRVPKKKGSYGMRHNYVLRVFADRIVVVVQRNSTPSSAWSEWADEGRLELLGQLDLDGDGALDLLVGYYEHGAAIRPRRTSRCATPTARRPTSPP